MHFSSFPHAPNNLPSPFFTDHQTIFGDQQKEFKSSLCNFLCFPVTSAPTYAQISSSPLCSLASSAYFLLLQNQNCWRNEIVATKTTVHNLCKTINSLHFAAPSLSAVAVGHKTATALVPVSYIPIEHRQVQDVNSSSPFNRGFSEVNYESIILVRRFISMLRKDFDCLCCCALCAVCAAVRSV
jgi:hypothetical protein